MHPDTISIHAGQFEDSLGSVVDPINLSTTFRRDEAGVIGGKGFIYTRMDNPNRKTLEAKLAQLEGGVDALAFPSGMAACLAIIHSVLEPGMHLILPDDCYHGVAYLVKKIFPRWHISYTEVDMSDPQNVKAAIQPNTRLIIVESPSNPMLKITDIQRVCAFAREKGIVVAADNTWTTPLIQRPLEEGVDLVFHSTTKFFGGHSDILGGSVILKEKNDLAARLREFQTIGGVVPSPYDCWLLNRSIATLPLRLEKQCQNAAAIATYLSKRPEIEQVFFPGLPSHPNHEIAKRQMNGNFGSMLSVLIKGGQAAALAFAGNLTLFKHATSLGGVESLIEHRRSAEGVMAKSPENLLRISVGIEYINDLIHDLEQAFNKGRS